MDRAGSNVRTGLNASMSIGEPIPDACWARCRNCNDTIKKRFDLFHWQQLPIADVPFFLHDNSAFNFREQTSLLVRLLAGRPMDLVLPVDYVQHMVELPIISALERHPSRTHNVRAARLHVVAMMPVLSYVVDPSAHPQRMEAVAAALLNLLDFRLGAHFLVFFGHWLPTILGEPLLQVLHSSRNVHLATCDPTFSKHIEHGGHGKNFSRFAYLWSRGITIPYLARNEAVGAGEKRSRQGLMFHGGISRFDYGLRKRMIDLLFRMQQTIPVDVRCDFTSTKT
mmetsp:Transcript_16559/g.27521  ORF Transcript_16559/g.27521 Transcript_16559/m.27521 type:complete len:282 (-) Transcript_16559:75-920(-)